MRIALIASVPALSAVPVVFITLAAAVLLLCVRAVCGAMHVLLTRTVSLMLDASIGVMTVLFVVLVVYRFKTIG